MSSGPGGPWQAGLRRSASALRERLSSLLTKRKLDAAALQELEEVLLGADLGVGATGRILERFKGTRFREDATPAEVREALAEEIATILAPAEVAAAFAGASPFVILVVGVNGTGKTTTIGKLAHRLKAEGRSVLLVAGDTFRAAAIEQLQVWGARAGAPVMVREAGADAAGLAYDAVEQARQDGTDMVLIDTAGRLQNKADLMAELAKMVRVLRKLDPAAPHATLLVLDATTGQNARAQVAAFREICDVSDIIVAKLDGTARGGMAVAIAEEFGLPIPFVGVGEGLGDLQPFDSKAFARALVGAAE